MQMFRDVCAYSVTGERDTQQDSYLVVARARLLGVFDGHGKEGGRASEIAAGELAHEYGSRGRIPPDSMESDFHRIDSGLEAREINGGTTATVVHVDVYDPMDRARWVTCSNVGDSPAVLIDSSSKATVLTTAHNVENEDEVERMKALGVEVDGPYFLSGTGIGISRALGDKGDVHFPGIIAKPSVSRTRAEESGSLLVVASDGIITPATLEEVIGVAAEFNRRGWSMGKLVTQLVADFAPRTSDNATVIAAKI